MDSNDYFGFNHLQGEQLNTSDSLRKENYQQSLNFSGFDQLSSLAENIHIISSNQFNPFTNEFQTSKINIPSIQQNQNFDFNNAIQNHEDINNQMRESIELNSDTFSINPDTFLPTNQKPREPVYITETQQNRAPTDIEGANDKYPENVDNIINLEINQIMRNLEQEPIPPIKYEYSLNNSNKIFSFKEPLIRETESNLINSIPQINNDYLINQNSQIHNEEEIGSLDDLPLASDVLESGLDLKNINPISSLDKVAQFPEYKSTPKINEIKIDNIPKDPHISVVPKISPISAVPEIPPISAVPKISTISAVPEIPPISAVPKISPISAVPEIPPISAVPDISTISAVPEIPPISAIPEIPPTIENEIQKMTPISQVPHVKTIVPSSLSPVSRVVKSPEKIIVKIPKIHKIIVPKIQKVIVPSKSKIFINNNTINPEPVQVHLPSESTISYPATTPLFGTSTLTTEVNIPSTTTTLNIPATSNYQIPSATTVIVPNSIPFQTQTIEQTHIPIASTTLTPGIPMAISSQISPTLSQAQMPMTKTIIPIQTHIPYNQYTSITSKSINYTNPQLIPNQAQITQISPSLQQTNTFSKMTQNPLPLIYQEGLPINKTQVPSVPQYQYSLKTFTPLRKDYSLNQKINLNRSRDYNATTYRVLDSRSLSLDKISGKGNIFSPSKYINKTYRPRKL